MPVLSTTRVKSRLEVRIHFRNLLSAVLPDADTASINKKLKDRIRGSQDLFLSHEIMLRPVSYESLDLPELKVLDAAILGASAEQKTLRQAFTPSKNEAAVFLVDAILDPNGMPISGSALPEYGAVMIAKYASSWTFGHEIGHLLGIEGHTSSPRRLMYEDTAKIEGIPVLVWTELVTMRSSAFAQPVV